MTHAPSLLLQLTAPSVPDARGAALLALLATAAFIDWRTLRIPNWLTAGGMALGLASSMAGSAAPLRELLWSLGGLLAGLLILLPFYALRVMGAGDVKLMGAVGAFIGLAGIVPAVLCVFITGGLAALLFVAARRRLARTLASVKNVVEGLAFSVVAGQPIPRLAPADSVGKLPYGVSICLGTVFYLAARQLGYA
jgi:prepilin peptidase CpaA